MRASVSASAVRPVDLRPLRAFTLIEMLVVIAIIGIVAVIFVPALNNLRKSDSVAAATRQLLDDLNRARQLAISQRTTVYMVFCPSNYWQESPISSNPSLNNRDRLAISNLLDKQFVGYNFVTLRNVGDQPGRNRPRYLDEWRTLPEGIFIAPFKFEIRSRNNTLDIEERDLANPGGPVTRTFPVRVFDAATDLPFPTADTVGLTGPVPYVRLPYIAFDHLGQIISSDGADEEIIPIARGKVAPALDPRTKTPTFNPPDLIETPAGNSTNAYSLIIVDRLTGRARIERQKLSGS